MVGGVAAAEGHGLLGLAERTKESVGDGLQGTGS